MMLRRFVCRAKGHFEADLFYYLAPLFIIVTVVELKILLAVGNEIGFFWTLALIILTGIIGSWLASNQGGKVINAIRTDLQAGKMPADNIIGGLLILVGGVLLITPGICTDCVGLLLMLPPLRNWCARRLKAQFKDKFNIVSMSNINSMGPGAHGMGGFGPSTDRSADATETEARVIEDEDEQSNF